MKIGISDRLKALPPYLFVEIDKKKKAALDEGRDIVDLGIGDPDQPTPDYIVEGLHKAALDPSTHKYPTNKGMAELRVRFACWYKSRFGVNLNPDTEILPLIGSKEGIAHIPLVLVNPGDVVLSPNPSYPPYRGGTILAGGKVHDLPLKEENDFLPDFSGITKTIARRAKLLFLNYPNNPTGAVCEPDFFEDVVSFASRNNIVVCHDAAYTEIAYDGHKPASFLATEGAKEVGIEFHSLSKTYNMTGWRIGFACGNEKVIKALSIVKSNIDSGIFNAVQRAAIVALDGPDGFLKDMSALYRKRRDVLVNGLNSLGWRVSKPKATFYIWAKVFKGYTSSRLTGFLLEKADIVVTPGIGFGKYGEGYIRMALTVSEERLREVIDRLKKIL